MLRAIIPPAPCRPRACSPLCICILAVQHAIRADGVTDSANANSACAYACARMTSHARSMKRKRSLRRQLGMAGAVSMATTRARYRSCQPHRAGRIAGITHPPAFPPSRAPLAPLARRAPLRSRLPIRHSPEERTGRSFSPAALGAAAARCSPERRCSCGCLSTECRRSRSRTCRSVTSRSPQPDRRTSSLGAIQAAATGRSSGWARFSSRERSAWCTPGPFPRTQERIV